MSRPSRLFLAALLTILVVLAACRSDEEEAPAVAAEATQQFSVTEAAVGAITGSPTAPTATRESREESSPIQVEGTMPYRVGLVTEVGQVDDGAFNQAAYEGMQRAAEKYNITTAFIETADPADYGSNVEVFANQRYDLIIAVGSSMADTVGDLAVKYPESLFLGVDQDWDEATKNLQGARFREDQAGFLAGVLAGLMSESKIVGAVAGREIPPVKEVRNGYEHGVQCVCPGCQALGIYVDSFDDPARGRAAALSQIGEGADVIFGAGGSTGSGGILAAAQDGVFVIGSEHDEYLTTFGGGQVDGADRLLSSAIKRVDEAVYQGIERLVQGDFAGGTVVYGAKDNGVGMAPFHDAEAEIPAEVGRTLAAIQESLATGDLGTGVDVVSGDPIAAEVPSPGSCLLP